MVTTLFIIITMGVLDLSIDNMCNQDGSESFCRSYTYDRQLLDDVEKDEDGFVFFQVEEYEVYGLK